MREMENAWRTNAPFLLGRLRAKALVRLLVGISTFFGFWAFYDMHLYVPWQFRILKASAMTFEAHSGLWLATLETRSGWRFLVAAILIPSTVGVYMLLWNRNLLTLIVAAAGAGWLLYKVLEGARFDD